ncbi:oligopeptide/dipeptide ABC transporter, ATP-binding protein, C-terminal domain [Anaerolinea thermolimosa]|uniref:ABC transporter ATP-binding protein n=1 Tax=Anaerolinea thermolimosa TaxID=229919 RepID=UPI0007808B46|nr:oligopeptide/dipeptide ABC transporter, ATP-binding protein, C-terminal domain [Anaerolinea thermolimosa]
MDDNNILEVRNLKMYFPIYRGLLQRVAGHVKAVDGVSFSLREQEVLGLVGESGCGKTTVGRTILRLYDPTSGEVRFRKQTGEWVDVAKISLREMKPLRREMRMVFQDPFSSLNPRLTVKDIISEPLEIHGVAHGKEAEERVAQLMREVGLNPAYMRRYPHEFSGGQRQRIGLARALSLNPRLIIADEPVSALDVSVQAQVLNLMKGLQTDLGLTMIFVAHDLSVVEHISDRIAVMYVGKIVELADTDELMRNPLHPYTEALLSAVPPADPDIRPNRIRLQGEVPSPANPPSGCIFHPRCNYAKPVCSQQEPLLEENKPGHFVACHFASELKLRGIGE